ncbi:MAG: SCP2 sterol-binding domain-containing protein [Thermoplasmata archaeon]
MERLYEILRKFNERAQKDNKFRKDIEGLERKILVDFTDNGKYSFELKDSVISEIKNYEGSYDIEVYIDTSTFNEIIDGKTDALSAYILKKFRVKASLSDKLLISQLLK